MSRTYRFVMFPKRTWFSREHGLFQKGSLLNGIGRIAYIPVLTDLYTFGKTQRLAFPADKPSYSWLHRDQHRRRSHYGRHFTGSKEYRRLILMLLREARNEVEEYTEVAYD